MIIHENDDEITADHEQNKGQNSIDNSIDLSEIANRLPNYDEIRNIKIRAHEFEKR